MAEFGRGMVITDLPIPAIDFIAWQAKRFLLESLPALSLVFLSIGFSISCYCINDVISMFV
jgi:hypothetical protein